MEGKILHPDILVLSLGNLLLELEELLKQNSQDKVYRGLYQLASEELENILQQFPPDTSGIISKPKWK